MNQLLTHPAAQIGSGLNFPPWLAAFGLCLFLLAGVYATFLIVAGPRFSIWLRYMLPPTLRGRMALGFGIAAAPELKVLVGRFSVLLLRVCA